MDQHLRAKPFFVLLLLSAVALGFTSVSAQHIGWKPVTAEELQQKAGKVEADADAEAILWDVYVSDETQQRTDLQTVLHHYLKVKIFNERGREAFSKMDLPFGRLPGQPFSTRIRDIEARTTKPDGTVVELDGKDIFERDVVRGDNVKLKAKSFATPGIEPGAIVEFKWREIRGSVSYYQRLHFARDIPVQLVRYNVQPLDHPDLGMMGQPFNIVNTPFKEEKRGYFTTTASNVPSFREEPKMDPEYSARPWLLLYYTKYRKIEPEKFWKEHGRTIFNEHKEILSQTDEIKRAAVEAIGSETSPANKIELLFYFAQSKIRDVFDDQYRPTDEFIAAYQPSKNASEALKRGFGTSDDINHLFAALAIAAGFEARIAKLPRRSDIFFPQWFTDPFFLRTENVAIKLGDQWRYFDPGSKYIPFGMLRWEEEGQSALVSDAKEPFWHQTELSGPAKSAEVRRGKFQLTDDGTLEGKVTIEYTGHVGERHKELNDDETEGERQEMLRRLIKANVSSLAEVTAISIANVTDPKLPFKYEFDIRIPGYASRTGRRMFFQPNVFERNAPAVFPSSERRHPIYFEYPFSEIDEVTIDLPPGYELESPDSPGRLTDPAGLSVNHITMSIAERGKKLVYTRRHSFGLTGVLRFSTANYSALKSIFDAYDRVNKHTMSLKPSAATPAN